MVKLKFIAKVKTNFPDADFWIQRRGSEDNVGNITREFSKYHIGIKFEDKILGVIDPKFMYYWFQNLFMSGYWKVRSYGTLALKHIRVDDVKNFEI
jgi:hypothetical protein